MFVLFLSIQIITYSIIVSLSKDIVYYICLLFNVLIISVILSITYQIKILVFINFLEKGSKQTVLKVITFVTNAFVRLVIDFILYSLVLIVQSFNLVFTFILITTYQILVTSYSFSFLLLLLVSFKLDYFFLRNLSFLLKIPDSSLFLLSDSILLDDLLQ